MAAQIEQLPDLDEGLDAFTIIEMCERRMNQYAGRDVDYDTFARYYFGKQSGMGSPSAKAMNSQGRPLLRDSDSYGAGDGEYRSQRLAPIVDDYQALLGRMPASRVEPPDHEAAGIAAGETFGLPAAKTMFNSEAPEFQALRTRLEHEWTPQMQQVLDLRDADLPSLWDADFLFGPRPENGEDSYVLCEINASCVTPFPPGAPAVIATTVARRLAAPRS